MIQLPAWVFGGAFLVVSGMMFYSNYVWRTKIMKDNYNIFCLENLSPMMIAVVGFMFFIPYIPVTIVR